MTPINNWVIKSENWVLKILDVVHIRHNNIYGTRGRGFDRLIARLSYSELDIIAFSIIFSTPQEKPWFWLLNVLWPRSSGWLISWKLSGSERLSDNIPRGAWVFYWKLIILIELYRGLPCNHDFRRGVWMRVLAIYDINEDFQQLEWGSSCLVYWLVFNP